MDKKIKVVWICHFSDEKTRTNLNFSRFYYKKIFNYLFRRQTGYLCDFAVWVTNAICEFENFKDIDLTIIFPHKGLNSKIQKFTINGIAYACFRPENDYFISYITSRFKSNIRPHFYQNRKLIKQLIYEIQPDLVHVIGAENPYYSISALDIPTTIPSVVSLQTLLSDPDFIKNYPISKLEYLYRSSIEREIICKCNYIASPVKKYIEIVKKQIDPSALILNMTLAVGQEINTAFDKKEFDFVYFAANLNKAGDYAIEAFALVQRIRPDVTLNMSGAYSPELKELFDKRIKELGIEKNVIFSGDQPTHDAVLNQIKKSRIAVLPLKIDLLSGTIRESMACGLPVVTTITPETPNLNKKRESILLSEKGDFQTMANNMLRLIEDESYANKIRNNGLITIQELYSNKALMELWRKGYYEILDNFHLGKSFSTEIKSC